MFAAAALCLASLLSLTAAPADLDRDGDVDQDDFGHFQPCLSGPDAPQVDPSCQIARLDDDADVDAEDFTAFAACAGGPDVPATPGCTPAIEAYFPRSSVWYQDASVKPLDPQSSAIIEWLASNGGWGFGRMQIDFSIEVLEADDQTPLRSFSTTQDFYSPDCDHAPVPVPPGGALEGETGYQCLSDGDCHLIVAQRDSGRLYEMWRANVVDDVFYGGCLAVWDMTRVYGPAGRGENCTSADAAGFPIAPLLFTADEVVAGWIDHAIRFILPNARMRRGVYVHPATHAGAPSGPGDAPPYGAHFRLRADYPLAGLPNEPARVVARSLQRYGMYLADGGIVALTGQSDRFTSHKWSQVGLGPHDLRQLQVRDFEMLSAGTRYPLTYDCIREP